MRRAVRYRLQREARRARKDELRRRFPRIACYPTTDDRRSVEVELRSVGRGDTANQAWWDAWRNLTGEGA